MLEELAKSKHNETKKYLGLSMVTGLVTLIASLAEGFLSAKIAAINERAILAQVGINPDLSNFEGTLNLCRFAETAMVCIIVGGSILFVVFLTFMFVNIGKKELKNSGGK